MDALTLPARAARFAVVDAPFSSKLEVTGVSLMLQSHEARQPGVTLRAATPQKSGGESMPDRPAQTPPSRVHVPAVTPPCRLMLCKHCKDSFCTAQLSDRSSIDPFRALADAALPLMLRPTFM